MYPVVVDCIASAICSEPPPAKVIVAVARPFDCTSYVPLANDTIEAGAPVLRFSESCKPPVIFPLPSAVNDPMRAK